MSEPARTLAGQQRLTCHGHSRRTAPRPCGWFLGHADQPMHWRATRARPPLNPDGNDWRHCKSCGAWNCFAPDRRRLTRRG